MVAGTTVNQATKATARKNTSSGGKFGIQTPSQEQHNSAGNYFNKKENSNSNDDDSENDINYTGKGNQKTKKQNLLPFKTSNQQNNKLDLNKIKTAAPILSICAIILLPLLLIFGLSSLLFADIDENTQESMDVQYLAAREVAKAAMTAMLKNGSLPSTFAETLTENGLEVGYLDNNGTFVAGLRPNSENSIALASSIDSESTITDNSLVIRFNNTIIDADSWNYFAETNKEVYSKFKDSTYGRAAGHYDDAAYAFYSTINASRNVFSNYTNTDSTDFADILQKYTSTGSTSDYGIYDGEYCKDEQDLDNCNSKKTSSSSTKSEALDTYFNTLFDNSLVRYPKVHGTGGESTDRSIEDRDKVQAATIAYLVNTAVNANETYESMKYFLNLEEVMSKTKAGDGSAAPINELMTYLTTTDEETGLSAVQSDTLSSVLTKSFSGYTGSTAKQYYSLDRIQSLTEDLSDSAYMALATTSLDLLSNSGSSYGIQDKSRTLIKLLEEPKKSDYGCESEEDTPSNCNDYKKAHDDYLKYKNTAAYHTKTNSIIEELKTALSSNSSKTTFLSENGTSDSNIVGSQAGEIFSKGASILGSKIATFAEGGTAGTEDQIASYQKATNDLLAFEAEVERSEKSPFDITSQNTFLGSIVHSFSSYLYTSTSLSSFANIVTNSFSSILPGVFADNTSSFQTTYGNCPESSSFSDDSSYACSVYSYPQTTFDLDSLENFISNTSSQDKDETETAKKTSEYEEYIQLNNKRSSTIGYISHDIAEEYWDNKSIIEKAKGLFTQFEDFISNKITSSIDDYFSTYYGRFSYDDLAIITGTAFVNADGFEDAQAYCAYSRFLDQIGYFSEDNTNTASISDLFVPGTGKSEYVASLESYAEEFKNLSDTEYLARISGISEDEASVVLGYVAYNSYLASIDHASDLAFGKEEVFDFENSNQSEPTIIIATTNSEIKTSNIQLKRKEVTNVA